MTGLPRLLTVADVRDRYGLRDDRAARSIMRRAGGFVVANRTVVRVDDLDTWEREQAEAANAHERAQDGPRTRTRARGRRRAAAMPTGPLPAGWWETDDEAGDGQEVRR